MSAKQDNVLKGCARFDGSEFIVCDDCMNSYKDVECITFRKSNEMLVARMSFPYKSYKAGYTAPTESIRKRGI